MEPKGPTTEERAAAGHLRVICPHPSGRWPQCCAGAVRAIAAEIRDAEAAAERRAKADHHRDDRGRRVRTAAEVLRHINSDHPCCAPIGDVVAILDELEAAERCEREACARLVEEAQPTAHVITRVGYRRLLAAVIRARKA